MGGPDPQELLNLLQRLGLALAIGFLVGLERGWKQRNEAEGERVAGLRTFALIGLLGGLSGLSLGLGGMAFLAAMAVVFCGAFAAFQFRALPHAQNGFTTTVAGFIVYTLGVYATVGNTAVAAAAGVATMAILAFKQSLHRWLQTLTWPEIRSAVLILAATFIALPLLPDQTIDPWGAVNPRSLWLLTILVAAATFGGYIALRALGGQAGILIGTLAGAIVSSTAVTIDLARRARAGEIPHRQAAAAASGASVVSMIRVTALSFAFSAEIANAIWPAVAAAAGVALLMAVLLFRGKKDQTAGALEKERSPLDLVSVGRFAALLCAMTILANLMRGWLGDAGLVAFSATAGLADADAVTLAVGSQIQSGLAPAEAGLAILIAVLSNTAFKVVIGAIAGGGRFGGWFGGAMLASAAAGGMAFYFANMQHFMPG